MRLSTVVALLKSVGTATVTVVALVSLMALAWRSHPVVEAMGAQQNAHTGLIVACIVAVVYVMAAVFGLLFLLELCSYMPRRGQAGRAQEILRVASWLAVAVALMVTSTWLVHGEIMRRMNPEIVAFNSPNAFNIWLTAVLTAMTITVVLMPMIMGVVGWANLLRPSRSNRLSLYRWRLTRLRKRLGH